MKTADNNAIFDQYLDSANRAAARSLRGAFREAVITGCEIAEIHWEETIDTLARSMAEHVPVCCSGRENFVGHCNKLIIDHLNMWRNVRRIQPETLQTAKAEACRTFWRHLGVTDDSESCLPSS